MHSPARESQENTGIIAGEPGHKRGPQPEMFPSKAILDTQSPAECKPREASRSCPRIRGPDFLCQSASGSRDISAYPEEKFAGLERDD